MSQAIPVLTDVTTARWAAWDRFVAATPSGGFMQTSWWAEFRADWGYDRFASIFRDGPTIVGGALVLRYAYDDEGCFYYIPDGPILPDDPEGAAQVFEALLADVDQYRGADDATVSHLRIEPRWTVVPPYAAQFRPLSPRDAFTEPRHTRMIHLRAPEEAVLAQMKPKGRYNIRLAARHGVTVVEDPSAAGLGDFLRIYDDMAGRQGIERKPAEYFEALHSLLEPGGRGSLFFAELGGARLAAALVLWSGERATYFYGGSLDERREVMAPYALHWGIMRRVRALGLSWYDLWGVAPPGAVDHPWRHITAFKEKFGGVAVDLVPTLDLVYDERAYEAFAAAAATI